MSQDMSRFWTTYHALLDHEDQDGLPDPLMHEAAHWMNQCYLALRESALAGSTISQKATAAIFNRNAIFPIQEETKGSQ